MVVYLPGVGVRTPQSRSSASWPRVTTTAPDQRPRPSSC